MHCPWLILFAMLVCIARFSVISSSGVQQCDPSNPQPLGRVTLDEVSGRWYSHWIVINMSDATYPPNLYLPGYNMDFRGLGKVVINGRTTYKPKKCLYDIVTFRSTGEHSSWVVTFEYLNKDLEWRIIDTDKVNYILSWVCLIFDQNHPKLCKEWFMNVMTKQPKEELSESKWRAIHKSMIKTVCEDHLKSTGIYFGSKRVCRRLNDSEI